MKFFVQIAWTIITVVCLKDVWKRKWFSGQRSEFVILLNDNASPCVVNVMQQIMVELGWEVLSNAAYSQVLSPSDYYLFHVKILVWSAVPSSWCQENVLPRIHWIKASIIFLIILYQTISSTKSGIVHPCLIRRKA